jgi:hypothetical protein
MTFNFAKAKKYAETAMKNPLLEAIVLGASGAGKSYALGTLGVKTLYLYGTRESHGPRTASVPGGDNIVPICFDYGYWGDETAERSFTADESLELLQSILRDYSQLSAEKFGAIVLDGMAVLEATVKESSEWGAKCKTAQGKHNTFKETEASLDLIGRVIGWLKGAQRECGVHIAVTGIIDVKETDTYGGIQEASPRLQGYGLAESINMHFGDIVVIGKMTKLGISKYKFQFMTDLTKTAKDEHGAQKRAFNFSPRLSGVTAPDTMDADMSALAEFKRQGMAKT